MNIEAGQLDHDTQVLTDLLDGFNLVVASPKLSQKARDELNEGIAKVGKRLGLMAAANAAVTALLADGYPDNAPEVADQDVIDEIRKVATSAALVPQDFKPIVLTADGGSVAVDDVQPLKKAKK